MTDPKIACVVPLLLHDGTPVDAGLVDEVFSMLTARGYLPLMPSTSSVGPEYYLSMLAAYRVADIVVVLNPPGSSRHCIAEEMLVQALSSQHCNAVSVYWLHDEKSSWGGPHHCSRPLGSQLLSYLIPIRSGDWSHAWD